MGKKYNLIFRFRLQTKSSRIVAARKIYKGEMKCVLKFYLLYFDSSLLRNTPTSFHYSLYQTKRKKGTERKKERNCRDLIFFII